MDPISFAYQSPYACFDNNPIYYTDIAGNVASGNGDKDTKTHTNALVIVMGDKDNWDKTQMEKDNSNWKVFPANTLEEGAKMMEAYKKDNNAVFDNAFLMTHGSTADGGSIDYSATEAFTGQDVTNYMLGGKTQETFVSPTDVEAIQSVVKMASMVENGGIFGFGACLGGSQTDKKGNAVSPTLASSLGALLLGREGKGINLLFNQDLTTFVEPRKIGRDADNYVLFGRPMGASYHTGDNMKGSTLVQKSTSNQITVKTYQASFQLNSIGKPIQASPIKINMQPIKN